MTARQAVILCEGFDDRAFLAQWLEHRGCIDARRNGIAVDPWGDRVQGGGQFAYKTPRGAFVRIHPCDGRRQLTRALRVPYLQRHQARPLSRILVVYDSDSQAPAWQRTDGGIDQCLAQAREEGIPADAIVWGCDDDAETSAVPKQQTLERLVCASIVQAHPARASAVTQWLAAAPATVGADVKAHSYSFLAKWYADHGCEDFFRQVWRDPSVRTALERRLRAAGSWDTLESILELDA